MQDGALMGARFDKAFDGTTRMTIGLENPALSGNDPDTPGNELRTHLVLTHEDESGEGMFSMGALLGHGTASDEGARFVDEAVKAIEKVHGDVAALLALDSKPETLGAILDGQWSKLGLALDEIFGTKSALAVASGGTSAIRMATPSEEDILDDIADILDALSSEDSFVEATAEDGGGVFAKTSGGAGVLGAGAAADAFNRLKWSADATLGVTGSTRYGTALREESTDAKSAPMPPKYGAFSYSTMQETLRTADAATVSLTGIASYAGGTRAVSKSGNAYTGMMELQVRFNAETVSGVVSGLEDSEGLPWQHNFADADRIVLDDAKLLRNATWTNSGSNATVFYAANTGLLRPVGRVDNTFKGILLGRGADAGSEANGVWSVGRTNTSGYLAGGFGVMHVADTARPVPAEDAGSAATAWLSSRAAEGIHMDRNMTRVLIEDGMLTVKQRSSGYRDAGNDDVTYGPLAESYGDDADDTNPTILTAKFDLAALVEAGAGAETKVNGATWVSQVVSILETERDLLSTLQSLDSGDTQEAEELAWGRVTDAVQYRLLGNLRQKLPADYDALEPESDAIDLINRALDALSSNAKLEAALDPDGTGIFDHYESGSPPEEEAFVNSAKTKVKGRTFAQIRSEKMHQVVASLGTTSYTRFGIWRRQSTKNAVRAGGVVKGHGGPGMFAYSALDPTNAGTPLNPGFPRDGRARYMGETTALQNTTVLTGTARVDVTWNSLADSAIGLGSSEDGDSPSIIDEAGKMSVTISGLTSAAGDPLTYGGTPKASQKRIDAESELATTTGGAGDEIADIVLGSFRILVGMEGDNMGHLIVGDPDTTNGEIAPLTSGRLRFTALGMEGNTTVPDTDGTGVKALFVGQGVDGPLGVIGTYTIDAGAAVTPGDVDSKTSESIGRLGADGTQSVDVGVTIYGAFGAEAP